MIHIPSDFAVQPLKAGETAKDKVTCGTCGLSWDDSISTGYTPAPSARCPFEAFHETRIERHDVPPISALMTIAGITLDVATKVHAVLAREIKPENASEACARWNDECLNRPSWHERALLACDDLLDGCGVEVLSNDSDDTYTDGGVRFCPPFTYVNFGDTYDTTLIRDHDASAWIVASWGDVWEEYEREHAPEEEDEEDENEGENEND